MKNWMTRSTTKKASTTRLIQKRAEPVPGASSPCRKEISKGVTTAVNRSQNAMATSHQPSHSEFRGWTSQRVLFGRSVLRRGIAGHA